MPRADRDIRDHLITEMEIPPSVVDFASDHWEAADLVLQMIHRNPKNRPNLINILLHPYFSLTNEALKNFFQSEIAGMHFGGSYKELTDFYSQTEIEKWYQSLDPKLKFKDIKEEKDRIQPILRNVSDTFSFLPRT